MRRCSLQDHTELEEISGSISEHCPQDLVCFTFSVGVFISKVHLAIEGSVMLYRVQETAEINASSCQRLKHSPCPREFRFQHGKTKRSPGSTVTVSWLTQP